MSADELDGWIGFNAISPIGRIRGDLQAGIIAETMANCHIGRGQKPFCRTDFMPFYEAPPQTDEEIGDAIIGWAKRVKAAFEARKKRRAGNG